MDEVANYKLACTSAQAMVQDYHAGYPPFVHADCAVPLVPCDSYGCQRTDDVPFEYIELRMPDGKNRLAVLTPFEVKLGPGPRFHCVKVG